MKSIPLSAVPSQAFESQLSPDKLARISLRTFGRYLYFTLDGVVATRLCRDRVRLLLDAEYHEFGGDFMIVDTQGRNDPNWSGLGARYILVYIPPEELT